MVKRKLGIAILAAGLVIASSLPSYAQENVNKRQSRDLSLPNPLIVEKSDDYALDYVPGNEDKLTTFPSKYNATTEELNIFPNLKAQGDYGVCFSFSTIASSEINVIKTGLNSTPDYSEMALAYFVNKEQGKEPLDNIFGDKNYSKDYWFDGGNNFFVMGLLSSWNGLLDEAKAPYSSMPAVTYDSDGRITSADESVKVDLSYAYNSPVHLINSNIYNKDDIAAIKNEIMNGAGSVSVMFYIDGAYYNASTNAYYSDDMEGIVNHSVSIVGWDDDFSKDNFTKRVNGEKVANSPSADGAWLIRNSWIDSSDPVFSSNGYFWISYEESSLDNIFSFSYDSVDNFDNNYQYDGGFDVSYLSSITSVKAANVFKAKACEEGEILKAVSVLASNANIKYTVDIYLNPDIDNPESGYKATTQTGTIKYEGYNTINLDNPVELAKGDRFSIVVTFEKYGCVIDMPFEADGSNTEGYQRAWYRTEVALRQNESYFYCDGKWLDMADIEYEDDEMILGNVKIKGFTSNSDEPIVHTYTIAYELDGGSNSDENPEVYETSNIVTFEAASKKNYIFEGWYLESEFVNKVETTEDISGNVTLYAKFKEKTYNITYVLNGGKNNKDNPETYALSSGTIILKDATNKGYTFDGWYSNIELTKKVTKVKGASKKNITLYAKWKANTYYIKYNANGGKGTIKKQTATYDKSLKLKKNTMTRKGYKFLGWSTSKKATKATYKNKASVKNLTSKNKATVTLYAVWKKK